MLARSSSVALPRPNRGRAPLGFFEGAEGMRRQEEGMNAAELLTEVCRVMADVLVHHRARWGHLLGHQRQYEGWWKAEMAQALESWTWRADLWESSIGVLPEAKPRDFGIDAGPPTADLLVTRWDTNSKRFDTTARPRVWIELKERGTWWGETGGAAAKAFGIANDGLLSDLAKWERVKESGEVVLACQLTTHDGSYDERLPRAWQEQFDAIATRCDRAIERTVGFPIAGVDQVRWARFDAFIVNRG